MNFDKLGRVLLGLIVVATLCSAPSHADIRHQFDFNGLPDFQAGWTWPNKPFSSWFQDANAFVFTFDDAGTIQNDVLPQGGNGLALIHAQFVDDDLNPGNPINLSLLTISYDVVRIGSAPINTDFGLGFYVYDTDDQFDPNITNGDGLGLVENGPENNFMNAYLDANPDTPTHYDIKINASGGTVDGLANLRYQVWRDGVFQEEDSIVTRSVTHPGGYDNGFDAWGWRSFGGGKWEIDNIVVRDELFMIPEPTSLVMLGMGWSILAFRRRR